MEMQKGARRLAIEADPPFKHYRISYWKPLMKAMVRR
jgi:hypothetical protein